jgi:hypothetical protein
MFHFYFTGKDAGLSRGSNKQQHGDFPKKQLWSTVFLLL